MDASRHASARSLGLFAVVGLCLALGVWHGFAAATLPVTQDEAYYLAWARHPAWGYFDHPPAVAWVAALGLKIGDGLSWARLGSTLLTLASVALMANLYRLCGLRGSPLLLALVLSSLNLGVLTAGLLTTPDALLGFAWALALHEGAYALQGHSHRWISTGLAVGWGLLSKYTMLLIGPVFLAAVLLAKPRLLRSPWPYAGALLAFLVFAPNLVWNSEHHWITWRFQLRHGFSLDGGQMLASRLPRPEPALPGSPEHQLALAFIGAPDADEATGSKLLNSSWEFFVREVALFFAPLKQRFGHLADFVGSQLALWGFFLVPLVLAWRRRSRRAAKVRFKVLREPSPEQKAVQTLLTSACWGPLIFFGLVALGGKVEGNWAAVYVLAASPLLALRLPLAWPSLTLAGLCNTGLLTLAVAHSQTVLMPIPPRQDRVLLETHGYRALAAEVGRLGKGPLFADSYQLVAMLQFYLPDRVVEQWPGITRPSEYLRQTIAPGVSLDELNAAGRFWLVTSDPLPPRLPGFAAQTLRQARDCRQGGLRILSDSADLSQLELRGCQAIHTWYLVGYASTL